MTTLLLALTVLTTMRVDYAHTGDVSHEQFAVTRVVVEPQPWPGNPTRPLDDTGRGDYFFAVIDAASGRPLYSRGFNSIFGEWRTTAEGKVAPRTFPESVHFPTPDTPVRVVFYGRDDQKRFTEIWRVAVDPADRAIVRMKRSNTVGPLIKLHEAGAPRDKLDLLLLGDGYTTAERPKFERDARQLVKVLLATSPFKERRGDINVWGLCPPAAESGVTHPARGVQRQSPLRTTYGAFGTERYLLTFENDAWRDVAANAPYDAVEILVNSSEYGGGGIYGLYGTVSAGHPSAPYIFLHELAHNLAGLADEYYSADVAYLPPDSVVTEPWEPNVTALLDPARLKWRSLVARATPLPTPWPKEQYDHRGAEAEERLSVLRREGQPQTALDLLGAESQRQLAELLASGPYAGRVGAFAGANYDGVRYYRAQQDCLMFSRHAVPFCRVCRRAIDATLNLVTGR